MMFISWPALLVVCVVFTLIGYGLAHYGINAGIKIVYKIKEDKPLDGLTTPVEQNDTFEEEDNE